MHLIASAYYYTPGTHTISDTDCYLLVVQWNVEAVARSADHNPAELHFLPNHRTALPGSTEAHCRSIAVHA